MKPITGVAAVVLALSLTGCASSPGSSSDDQAFLHLTAYNDSLSAVDITTRIELGHEMCGLLKKHHGDAAAAEADMAHGAATFTPREMSALKQDAAVAYCPKYR